MLEHETLAESIIGGAIEVHRELGPGLLESAYCTALVFELIGRGHTVRREVDVPLMYKGHDVGTGFRIDLLVDDKVVLEVKSIDRLTAIHEAQLMTYLRLSGKRVGLLINFNVRVLKDGIVRRIL